MTNSRTKTVADFGGYKLEWDGSSYTVLVKVKGVWYDEGIGFHSFDEARELGQKVFAQSQKRRG